MPHLAVRPEPTKSFCPGPKTPRYEERAECRRQEIKKNERRQKADLFEEILAQGVLAGQSSGRNLDSNEDCDCRNHGHDPSQLDFETIDISDASAEHTADQDRKNEQQGRHRSKFDGTLPATLQSD